MLTRSNNHDRSNYYEYHAFGMVVERYRTVVDDDNCYVFTSYQPVNRKCKKHFRRVCIGHSCSMVMEFTKDALDIDAAADRTTLVWYHEVGRKEYVADALTISVQRTE